MQGSHVGGHAPVVDVGTIAVGGVDTPAGAAGTIVPGATAAGTGEVGYATGCAGTGWLGGPGCGYTGGAYGGAYAYALGRFQQHPTELVRAASKGMRQQAW